MKKNVLNLSGINVTVLMSCIKFITRIHRLQKISFISRKVLICITERSLRYHCPAKYL